MTQQEAGAVHENVNIVSATPEPVPASATPEPVPAVQPAPGATTPEEQNAAQAQQRAQEERSAQAGEDSAARTDPNDTAAGAGGMAFAPGVREIAGGGNIVDHTSNAPGPETVDPLAKQRRYISSRLAREAGTVIGRAPEDIGLWAKGETYRGNGGILVDIDTLEKHRFPDGYRFDTDAMYANSRDLPHALVDGDLTKNLSGE